MGKKKESLDRKSTHKAENLSKTKKKEKRNRKLRNMEQSVNSLLSLPTCRVMCVIPGRLCTRILTGSLDTDLTGYRDGSPLRSAVIYWPHLLFQPTGTSGRVSEEAHVHKSGRVWSLLRTRGSVDAEAGASISG